MIRSPAQVMQEALDTLLEIYHHQEPTKGTTNHV